MKTNEIIIKSSNIIEYLRLKKLGYITLWCGEGKICMTLIEDKQK